MLYLKCETKLIKDMDNTNIKSAGSEEHVTASKRKEKKQRLYKFKTYVHKSKIVPNMKIAYINIIDDNWTWEEYMLIDARKEKEFRTYVKSNEFRDFVCDLIGHDFKGLDYEGMWKLREEKYKTGIVQEFRDKLKQYKYEEN